MADNNYDFLELVAHHGPLSSFIRPNKYGHLSVDFFNPAAVKALNTALIKSRYGLTFWDIPSGYLCPPLPGRADYIHAVARLIAPLNHACCLDIGVGANCIYPIIGRVEYGWEFVGVDIDPEAIRNARLIVSSNELLLSNIALREQSDKGHIFHGVILPDDHFDVTICNPPFHSSQAQAQRGTVRKLTALHGRKTSALTLNFQGCANELWCAGGEKRFILDMIAESVSYGHQCGWFTTLVANEDHLEPLKKAIVASGALSCHVIDLARGNKRSRILAWSFSKRLF
ncbi:MAG: 23S rRNA (adenine(1618)-N(6))-methyltransferase RlmF [Mucinivorans sp.]